jgi:hypothetical protein
MYIARGQCYDSINIFTEKMERIGDFESNYIY